MEDRRSGLETVTLNLLQGFKSKKGETEAYSWVPSYFLKMAKRCHKIEEKKKEMAENKPVSWFPMWVPRHPMAPQQIQRYLEYFQISRETQ